MSRFLGRILGYGVTIRIGTRVGRRAFSSESRSLLLKHKTLIILQQLRTCTYPLLSLPLPLPRPLPIPSFLPPSFLPPHPLNDDIAFWGGEHRYIHILTAIAAVEVATEVGATIVVPEYVGVLATVGRIGAMR